MKTIEVVAGIIKKDNKILATQRGYGEFKGLWEFPGGKIEIGETQEQALKREILEELEVSINIDKLLQTIEYTYPTFHLVMHCYVATLQIDNIVLKEHKALKWVTIETIDSVKWLPADLQLIPKIKEIIS